jgi:hypothetical protein
MSIAIHQPREGDPNEYWTVEQTFGTKLNSKRCQDVPIEDPLLEPMKISGSFVCDRRPAMVDKDGNAIVTSGRELIVGESREFDFDNATVCIEMNAINLGLSTFSQMINKVNASPLWGLPARCVKLNNVTWDRKVWSSCCFYYTRKFDFAIDYSTTDDEGNLIGFDHWVADQGNRCISGVWVPNIHDGDSKPGFVITAPATSIGAGDIMTLGEEYFNIYKGPPPGSEIMPVSLDGEGRPAGAPLYTYSSGTKTYTSAGTAGPPAFKRLQYYREANFLSLGIPTSL